MQAAIDWLRQFDCDALRYPILIVLGPSRAGKTEWAKSLFASPLEIKIGSLTFFPDKLQEFKRGVTDGLVLDDVRDLQFIVDHQEKLQGKYDCLVEFGSTTGGTCAYRLDLFRIPVVVTVNYSTANLQWLEEHDWLGNPGNRVVVRFGEASATVNSLFVHAVNARISSRVQKIGCSERGDLASEAWSWRSRWGEIMWQAVSACRLQCSLMRIKVV